VNSTENIFNRTSPLWITADLKKSESLEEDESIVDIFKSSMRSIDEGSIYNCSRARSGGTPVYYSPDKLSVIKHCRSASSERLNRIEEAKLLCQEMHLTHIRVPIARTYKEFLLEECLPIDEDVSLPIQIRMYCLNRDAFTKLSKELTRFFCRARIGDLVDDQNRVKYDNIPLYLDPETGEGMAALVDLEEFRLETFFQADSSLGNIEEEEEEDFMFPSFLKTIRTPSPRKLSPQFPIDPVIFKIFPLHFEEIMEELRIHFPDIDKYSEHFSAICENTIQSFQRYL